MHPRGPQLHPRGLKSAKQLNPFITRKNDGIQTKKIFWTQVKRQNSGTTYFQNQMACIDSAWVIKGWKPPLQGSENSWGVPIFWQFETPWQFLSICPPAKDDTNILFFQEAITILNLKRKAGSKTFKYVQLNLKIFFSLLPL